MSSNMIKASAIAYDKEKIKKLDFGARENEILERVRALFPAAQMLEESQNGENFVQGLPAEDLGEMEVQPAAQEVPLPAAAEVDIEAIKNSLREEIMAEMSPILQRKGDDIVAVARAQADGLVDAARRDAEIAKESILKMASAQGYEEGLKKAKEEEEKAVAALEAEKVQLRQQYEQKFAELEPSFIKILTELVRKVTNVAYDYHTEILSYLIETGLGFAQKDTTFTVSLSEADYQKYEETFLDIQEKYAGKLELEFKKSLDLPEGSCRLENENRVIDCGLERQLNGLLEDLALLGE